MQYGKNTIDLKASTLAGSAVPFGMVVEAPYVARKTRHRRKGES